MRDRDMMPLLDNAKRRATQLGHQLSSFRVYKSNDDKFTAYCHKCGWLAIVYRTPLAESNGKALTHECPR